MTGFADGCNRNPSLAGPTLLVPLSRNMPAVRADTFAQRRLRKPVCSGTSGAGPIPIVVNRVSAG